MNQITLLLKNQSVLINLADSPIQLIRIEGIKNLYSQDLREYLTGSSKMQLVLTNIIDAFATFSVCCPEDLARIYFGKSLKECQTELNSLISENVFRDENCKERIILKELVREYKKYKELENKILSFDEDGFPLFCKKAEQEKIVSTNK